MEVDYVQIAMFLLLEIVSAAFPIPQLSIITQEEEDVCECWQSDVEISGLSQMHETQNGLTKKAAEGFSVYWW